MKQGLCVMASILKFETMTQYRLLLINLHLALLNLFGDPRVQTPGDTVARKLCEGI